MTVLPRTLVAAALLALASTVTYAQSGTPAAPAETSGEKGGPLSVCRPDLEKLCKDAKGAQRRECLETNADKLSPACSAAFADINAKAKAMREACTEDVKLYCSSARKNKASQSIVQCLEANKSNLTSACSAAIAARYKN